MKLWLTTPKVGTSDLGWSWHSINSSSGQQYGTLISSTHGGTQFTSSFILAEHCWCGLHARTWRDKHEYAHGNHCQPRRSCDLRVCRMVKGLSRSASKLSCNRKKKLLVYDISIFAPSVIQQLSRLIGHYRDQVLYRPLAPTPTGVRKGGLPPLR